MKTWGYGHSLGVLFHCAAVMLWYVTGGGPGLLAIVMMGSIVGAVFAMFLRRVYLRAYTGDPVYLSVDVAQVLSTLENRERFAPRLLTQRRYAVSEATIFTSGLLLFAAALTGWDDAGMFVGAMVVSGAALTTAGWLPAPVPDNGQQPAYSGHILGEK